VDDYARAKEPAMAIDITEQGNAAKSEAAVCDDSRELRVLPVLAEWRAQEPGVTRHPAPRHAGSARADEIPRAYALMPADELDSRIAEARSRLGRHLVILGHHYQRDEIIKWADARGDSFKLAQFAASRPEADYIVFCGVHFMAESADVLSGPHQRVVLPNPAAGCSMADMASIAQVAECWQALHDVLGKDLPGAKQAVVPVTYMNSAADLKAFCGREGGIVCTSSNAASVLRWAFEHGERVLFFPDEHLGRNTALAMGIPEEQIVVWNPSQDFGGIDDDKRLLRARVILWKGWCSTHQRFTVEQIAQARAEHPGVRVVVHPECRHDVVAAADLNGSTEYIIKVIEESSPGSTWGVGTEINLVRRLAIEHHDKTIFCLDPVVCPCSTMYRIHPAYLAWVLEALVEGRVINQVSVDGDTARWARVALERMLANKA
jgi:quinolinate synthase